MVSFYSHGAEKLAGLSHRDLIKCRKLGLVKATRVTHECEMHIRYFYEGEDLPTLKRRYEEHKESVKKLNKTLSKSRG